MNALSTGKFTTPNTEIRSLIYGISLLVALLLNPSQAQAQVTTNITTDGTLGTQVNQNPSANNVQEITGGTRPGNGPNLFHSFGQFNVGAGDVANFLNETRAPTDNILGRVTGGNPSHIFGTLQTTDFGSANLFLLNPQGVVFGPTAQLNVKGSFYTSTADFLRFENGQAFYANASLDGSMGSVLHVPPLQAFGFIGDPIAFGFTGEYPAQVEINQSGLTVRDGKNLSVVAGDIAITGSESVSAPHGKVMLVSVGSPGEVRVNAPDPNFSSFSKLGEVGINDSTVSGQAVVIRGERFVLENSTIRAISNEGLLNNQNPQSTLQVFTRGDIQVGPTAALKANGIEGGLLHLESSDGTTWVSGTLASKGNAGPGGNVRVLGDRVGLGHGAVVDASGQYGGGTVLVGGDFQGSNPNVKNASQTHISPEVSIYADGGIEGSGGTVVVWSDGATRFFGNIRAQGGTKSGNGGFAEVSGKSYLDYQGFTDLTASHGPTGALLLDPESITITDTANDSNVSGPPFNPAFEPEGQGPAILTITTLKSALNAADVTVQTVDNGTPATEDPGNLTLDGEFDYDGIGSGTLALKAHNDIIIEGKIHDSNSSGDRLNLTLTADSDLSGSGTLEIKEDILTRGGGITLEGNVVQIQSEGGAMLTINSVGEVDSDAGSVMITGEKQVMLNNTAIQTFGLGNGNPGAVTIITDQNSQSEMPLLLTDTNITASVADGDGTVHEGGNLITLKAPKLMMNVEAVAGEFGLFTETIGEGNAGNILVEIRDTADFIGTPTQVAQNPIELSSRVRGSQSEGQGGVVTIKANKLTLELAKVTTDTEYAPNGKGLTTVDNGEAGLAGNVILEATESLTLTGTEITSQTQGPGRGGDVFLQGPNEKGVGDLLIQNQSSISTQSVNTVGRPFVIDGQTDQGQVGAGGNITLRAQTAQLFDSTLTAQTNTYGNAGNITFNVENVRTDNGVMITSSSTGNNNIFPISPAMFPDGSPGLPEAFEDGQAGNINILGTGTSGLVKQTGGTSIPLANTIRIHNSSISTNSNRQTGGNITLNADLLIDIFNSQITSEISEGTLGGNIDIDPQFIVIQGDNTLISTASRGEGGGGTITLGRSGDALFIDASRPVTAFLDVSSQSGQSGTLSIRAAIQSLAEQIDRPEVPFINLATLFKQPCAAQTEGSFSSIVPKGLDALPPEPGDFIPSPLDLDDLGGSSLNQPSGGGQSNLEAARLGFAEAYLDPTVTSPSQDMFISLPCSVVPLRGGIKS